MAESPAPQMPDGPVSNASSSVASTSASSSSDMPRASSGGRDDAPAAPTSTARETRSAVVGLDALLDDARTRLRRFAWTETVAGLLAGATCGLLLAAFVVDAMPFSSGLRVALCAAIAAAAVLGAALVVVRRMLPLRHDLVVAARLEEAMRRSGDAVADAVRGAVELKVAALDDTRGRSRALCDAHIDATVRRVRASDARGQLAAVSLEHAVPTNAALATAVALLGVWAAWSSSTLPARLHKLFDDDAAAHAIEEQAASLLPLVTDLTLTLRFPAYMQEPDQVIAGASGDVTAPRGTEVIVRGRADRAVRAATLVVVGGDKPQESAAALEDKRTLTARFVVQAAGTWRFRLDDEDGTTLADPVAHKVLLRADDAPTVELLAPDKDATVQLDDDVAVAFAARDDFGIGKVRVLVKRQGSAREPYALDLVDGGGQREARGGGRFKIADTGARPGEKLSVYVEALDNDTVGGPKAGRSSTRVLTVFSASEHHREVLERLQDVLHKMVDVLGDHLENPFVVGVDAPMQQRALVAQVPIAPRAQAMLTAFDDALLALADDELEADGVRRALANLRTGLGQAHDNLKRAVDATPRDATHPVPLGGWRRVVDLQAGFVLQLEKGALYLEDLIQRERIAETQQLVDDMKRAQQDLKELLRQFKDSGDPAIRQALLDEIKRMQEQLGKLAQRLGELQREIPDEYLNAEAFQAPEMMEQADSLDEMIEQGRLDDAAKTLEQMLEQTEKMVKDLEETGEQYGGDEYKELRDKMQRFGDELEALEKGQQEALDETERIMDAARKKTEEKLRGKTQQLVAEARKAVEKAQKNLRAIDDDALAPTEQEDVQSARSRLEDLDRALQSLEIEDALQAVVEAEATTKRAAQDVAGRIESRFGPRGSSVKQAREQLDDTAPLLKEVREKLEELAPDPSSMLDAAQKQALQRNAERQQQLQEGADKLRQQLDEIGKEAPIFGPQHKQALDGAREAMQRAGRQLKSNGVRGARASQSQAHQRLAELREAMQQMGKDGQGGGMPMPLPGGGSPGAEREGDGRGHKSEDVKIPDGSQFKVPDAFRKDILDAMRESAPGEWANEVKKYYEGLIQ